MDILDNFETILPNGKRYENDLDDYGQEWEFLDGVGLKNGHYCKHYCQKRDWSGESADRDVKDLEGRPAMQHYCSKRNHFMGFAYCCGTVDDCYEEGKSAGVKRLLNKIRKEREYALKR